MNAASFSVIKCFKLIFTPVFPYPFSQKTFTAGMDPRVPAGLSTATVAQNVTAGYEVEGEI